MIAAAVLAFIAATPEPGAGEVEWYEHPVRGGFVVEYLTDAGDIVPVRFAVGQRSGHLQTVVIDGRTTVATRIDAPRSARSRS